MSFTRSHAVQCKTHHQVKQRKMVLGNPLIRHSLHSIWFPLMSSQTKPCFRKSCMPEMQNELLWGEKKKKKKSDKMQTTEWFRFHVQTAVTNVSLFLLYQYDFFEVMHILTQLISISLNRKMFLRPLFIHSIFYYIKKENSFWHSLKTLKVGHSVSSDSPILARNQIVQV